MKARKMIACLLMVGTVAMNIQTSYAAVLHTITTSHEVTNGVTLITEEVLTSNGWQDINMLKVDLSNPYIEIGVMESNTLGNKDTVLNLVNNNNAVAGINADFFDMSSTYAPSFGPVINDGELNHAYNSSFVDLGPSKYMGTLLIDQSNNVFMDYYGIALTFEKEDEILFEISNYNKLSGNIYRPLAIDSTYYSDNTEVLNKYSQSIYTVLVEDNTIVYKSKQDEVVQIEDGQVAIILNVSDAVAYYPMIQEGDNVSIKSKIVLNGQVTEAIESMKLGVGGGGLIMKNGQAYQGSAHQVTPTTRAPRTVVATTYTPDEVLLFTIDGRVNTLGATHAELVEILKRYNVKDAMYLDGGGSTTLVARDLASTTISLINNPSDGSMRRVTNGIGVFTNAPQGTLDRLYIESDFTHTFEGEAITFDIKGVDEYGNPVTINESNVNMSVEGIDGTWNGMSFNPTTSGTGLVVAEVNGVQVGMEIIVTDKPAGIRIETSQVQVDANSSRSINVVGIDKYGYEVAINQNNISWESQAKGVSVANGILSANGQALGTITASYKGITDTAEVIVGERVVPLYSFEDSNGRWLGSPSNIQGTVHPSTEIKYHGNQSLKMAYTFEKSNSTQVAYTVLDTPVIIPEDARSINLWVYAQGQNDGLKMQLTDANGTVHYLDVASTLNYSGWKYQSAIIPEEVALPAELNRIYTYSTSNDEARTNAIYMDHLSITRGLRSDEGSTVRDDYRFDTAYREEMSAPTSNDYVINISGGLKEEVFSETDANVIYNELEKYNNKVLFTSANEYEHELQNSNTYSNSYNMAMEQDVQVLFLGTNQGGLRQTNASQWTQLKSATENSDNHLIIVAGSNPLTQFSDKREGEALHEYLVEYKDRTGKDVFVVYEGSQKEAMLEEGIRYIGLGQADDASEYEYLHFKIYQGNLYYTFQTML